MRLRFLRRFDRVLHTYVYVFFLLLRTRWQWLLRYVLRAMCFDTEMYSKCLFAVVNVCVVADFVRKGMKRG